MASSTSRLDLDKPRWDQNTFSGRLKYFFWMTDPRTIFVPSTDLLKAQELVRQYKAGTEPKETTTEEIFRAQQLTLSAFHPDTGDLQNVFGRMSFQVPGGMALTGALLAFYKSTPQVVFWQWVNQSFNALVNYTNRNAKSEVNEKQLAVAYVSATLSAVGVSIGLKSFLAKRVPFFFQRFVPFAAVAVANMVNIPLMRQQEVSKGITCYDENGKEVVNSKIAAVKGISQVVTSRITIAMPGMLITPFIMQRLDKIRLMQKYAKFLDAPIQTIIVGCFLLIMVPVGCSLFPQKCSIQTQNLSYMDKEALSNLQRQPTFPQVLYFNKGL